MSFVDRIASKDLVDFFILSPLMASRDTKETVMTPTTHTTYLARIMIGAGHPDKETVLGIRLAVQQHLTDCGISRGQGIYGVTWKDCIGGGFVDDDEKARDLHNATWTGKNGVSSLNAFLADHEAQRECFLERVDASYIELGKAQNLEVRINRDLVLSEEQLLRLVAVASPVPIIAFAETGDLRTLDKAAAENGFDNPLDMIQEICVEAGVNLGVRKDNPDASEITFH